MKANWHQDVDVAVSAADPFDGSHPISLASSVPDMARRSSDVPMKPISLDTPTAELHADLSNYIKREARLFDRGITCELKDNEEFSCLACPISEADDTDNEKCSLCRIGMAEEVTISMLIAKRAIEQGDGVGRLAGA